MRPVALLFLMALLAVQLVLAEETPSQAASEEAAPAKTTLLGRAMPAFPKSLMFTEQDRQRIAALLADRPVAAATAGGPAAAVDAQAPELRPNVYLSALVYTSPGDWSAWINGLRFRPGSAEKGVRAVKATPRWVEMDIDTVEGLAVRVRLSPNQTYLSSQDKIVDGIVP
ncbi:MAG: hypothetical protein OEL53_15195 [Rhodospirillales bacterium]|nr:hypothetical protein [Rhodospirillales bacterium]